MDISLFVGIASFLVSVVATFIAWSSLRTARAATSLAEMTLQQAKDAAERGLADWRQTKWVDLYLQGQAVCDALEYFQARHKQHTQSDGTSTRWDDPELVGNFNNFIVLNRKMQATAVVFPQNPAIDKLLKAAAAFSDPNEAFSQTRLEKIGNAVQDI